MSPMVVFAVEAAQGFYVLNELLHPEGCRIFNLLFSSIILFCLSARLIRIVVDVNLLFILRAGQPGEARGMRNEDGGGKLHVLGVGCYSSFCFLLCLLLIDLSSLCKVTQRFVIHGTGL